MAEIKLAEDELNSAENPKPSFFRVCLDSLTSPNDDQLPRGMYYFDRISRAWKLVIVVFTIVLLFGSPIQFLFTTKDADIIFDILYILALVVFVADMILNVLVDPAYLGFSVFRRTEPFDHPRFCRYGIGSFNMWCDVVSTATLFYDISYMNNVQYSEEVVELTLDQYGLPVSACILAFFVYRMGF
jgi:hypothetical protein